jgi:hypothetical protein
MRKLVAFVLCLALVYNAPAQTAEDSVKAAVNSLFTAMKNADSAGIIRSFTSGGLLQSVNEKDGKTSIADEKVVDFAHIIAGLKKGDGDERITFDVVKIDGPLAIVWTPYQFYYKGAFSHCGVDSYQLVRINGEWKIQYLIDTRRKGGCL